MLDDNSDTTQVIIRYSSKKIREIVYYKDNRPNRNIGFTEQGDTLTFPRLIHIKSSDSLFAFIPIGLYKRGVMYYDTDSLKIFSGNGQPKYTIDIMTSTVLKIDTNMRSENNKIIGVFKFETLNGAYDYWPFNIDINNH